MATQQPISFTVPVEVAPKQTKENASKRTKTGKPFTGRYTPMAVKVNANVLAGLINPYRPHEPLHGPLDVRLLFLYPDSPSARSEDHRLVVAIQPLCVDDNWKTTRPDPDNLAKQVLDVLERCRFLANDAQVSKLTIMRRIMED